jgi:hypothetical protein
MPKVIHYGKNQVDKSHGNGADKPFWNKKSKPNKEPRA